MSFTSLFHSWAQNTPHTFGVALIGTSGIGPICFFSIFFLSLVICSNPCPEEYTANPELFKYQQAGG